MFTGIVEEQGKLLTITTTNTGKQLRIKSDSIHNKMKIGDSVAVNGVCQTITKIDNNIFAVDTIYETIQKTTLGNLHANSLLNLELALTYSGRLGGHFVQGHIDTIGKIIQINRNNSVAEFMIAFPANYRKYLALTGSIAVDGVSLTTAEVFPTQFKVAIIPHTIENTLFTQYKIGDEVNLEFDIIGKYVDSILTFNSSQNTTTTDLSRYISQPNL